MQASLLIMLSGVILFGFRRYRQERGDKSARWLAAAYLVNGLGLALLALEQLPSTRAGTIVGNTLLLAFCGLAGRGLALATGQRSRTWVVLLAADAVTVAAFSYWTWISPSWLLRLWASALVTAGMYGALVWLLSRAKERVIQPAVRAMMALFALHIVIHVARLLVWHYAGTSLWFSGMNILTIGGVAMSYLWANSLRMEEQMEAAIMTDPLTGLYNRRAMDVIGKQEVSRAVRAGLPCSALMLDVDRFKDLNDTQGHVAGDAALRAIAGVVQSVCDLGVRLGGDELFLLLPERDEAAATSIAARIRLALSQLALKTPRGECYTLSVSIGCVTLRGASTTVDSLMHAADVVLYGEKHTRNGSGYRGGVGSPIRGESDDMHSVTRTTP